MKLAIEIIGGLVVVGLLVVVYAVLDHRWTRR
jgi:hypothetical protein